MQIAARPPFAPAGVVISDQVHADEVVCGVEKAQRALTDLNASPGNLPHSGLMEPAGDPILDALDELVAAGRDNVVEWMGLMTRVDQVREARRRGVPYADMALPGTSIIDTVSSTQERLAAAAAKFRRVTARELHRNGVPAAVIARSFGVTRQRIAALLTNTPHDVAPEEQDPRPRA